MNEQEEMAMKKYRLGYSSKTYLTAVTGRTIKYANALINEAMARSGHPHYKLSNRNWSKKAQEFLKLFS